MSIMLIARYGRSWYLYDEWEFVHRATSRSLLGGAFQDYQGHLNAATFLLYRAQVAWFGLDSRALVYAAFVASLAALYWAISRVLRQMGVPSLAAAMGALALAYFGRGAETMTWEFSLSANLTLAAVCAAMALALSARRDVRASVTISAILVVAVGLDSTLAIIGLLPVAAILAHRRGVRTMLRLLAVPAAANALWLVTGFKGANTHGDHRPWPYTLRKAGVLLRLSSGGTIGTGARIVLLTLGILALLTLLIVARRSIPRDVAIVCAACLGTALVLSVTISYSRAGLFFLIVEGSRYVHYIGVFLGLGLYPAIAHALRRWHRGAGATAVLFALIFIAGLPAISRQQAIYDAWGSDTRTQVAAAISAVRAGCPTGQTLDPGAPASTSSPQLTVGLLQQLLEDDAFDGFDLTEAAAGEQPSFCVSADG